MNKQQPLSLETLIRAHLENPTHEMQTAFRKLPAAHKWLLFSFLQTNERHVPAKDRMKAIEQNYERLRPSNVEAAFAEVLLELTEGFLQKRIGLLDCEELDWMHPSCRDLTIDELARNARSRRQFLSNCSSAGIGIAASVGGGSKGDRLLPLLKLTEDWSIFSRRCVELQLEGEPISEQLWHAYKVLKTMESEAAREGQRNLESVLRQIWPSYYSAGCRQYSWINSRLRAFFELRAKFCPKCIVPGLVDHWIGTVDYVEGELDEKEPITEAINALENFVSTFEVIHQLSPQFFRSQKNRAEYDRAIAKICERGDSEAFSDFSWADENKSDLEKLEDAYKELADCYKDLSELPFLSKDQVEDLGRYARHFEYEADAISDFLDQMPEEENTSRLLDSVTREFRHISVNDVFTDL